MVEDGFAHVGNNAAQLVGADMGVGINGDGRVGPVLNKAVHDVLDIASFGTAGV